MSYYYRDPYYDDRNAGCFGALAILIIIAVLAIYIGAYVLLFFMGIGLAVGLTFSLIIYVRSLINAIKSLSMSAPSASNSLLKIIKIVFVLFYQVMVNSIRETMTVVSNSFTKFCNYRVLSFQKWMWFTVVVTVTVCEIIFVIAVIALEAALIFAVCYVLFAIICAVLLVDLIVALVYDSVHCIKDMINGIRLYQRMDHFTFSTASTYATLLGSWKILMEGKKLYVKSIIPATVSKTKLMWAMSGAYRIISVRKWFYIASSLVMGVVSFALNFVFMLSYTLVFTLIWIANAIFTTGVVLFRKVRP